MHRTCSKLAGLSTLLALGTFALAMEPPAKPTAGGSPRQDGVVEVTDGAGNPVPRAASAGAVKPTDDRADDDVRIQRGQAWWPYAGPLPPYTDVTQRVESMTEFQIAVNGVVTLDVREPWAARSKMPAELRLEESSQLARPTGFYLVKIDGLHAATRRRSTPSKRPAPCSASSSTSTPTSRRSLPAVSTP